ncbi:hypothetical protein AB0D99_26815 [Streptomyces sp. NPDC047971]|uniref:hypothetical protein n=1 Tax=Streptomyces sp. NPDC047971 TaxID=3154499 RepID=UPI0033CAA1C3
MTSRLTWTVSALLACALLAGCSTVEGKTADVRDGAQMLAGAQRTSSQVLDMIGLKGKVTDGPPLPLPCEGYEAEVERVDHPWSIYDLPYEELERAYARMRTTLPAKGWKITQDGPDESAAKTPTLRADAPDGDYAVELRLMDNRKHPTAKTEALISLTVVSRCFRPS